MRTEHHREYVAAHAKTIKTDVRSLHSHWDEGRIYLAYGERQRDIAADVGISPGTVGIHIRLFRVFPTLEELDMASEKFNEYNYSELIRLATGKGPKPRYDVIGSRIWECADCGSRNLRMVDAS